MVATASPGKPRSRSPRLSTVLIPIPDRDFDPTEVAVSWRVLDPQRSPRRLRHRERRARGCRRHHGQRPGPGHLVRATGIGRDPADRAGAAGEQGRSRSIPGHVGLQRISASGELGEGQPRRHRRVAAARRSPRPRNAQLHRQRDPATACRRRLCPRGDRGRDLSRRAACRPQRGSRHRSLGALRTQDHRADLGAGAHRLAPHPRHPLLGSPTTTAPTPRNPANPTGTCRCSRKSLVPFEDSADFCDVARGSPHWRLKTSGMVRDTASDSRPAFVVDDGNYVSARWPGDTHTFATVLSQKLAQTS